MIRAVLDANIFVSAAIQPKSVPRQVTDSLTKGEFTLVLSPALIVEVELVMRRPRLRRFLRDVESALEWFTDLVILADVVPDTKAAQGVCRDPDDDKLIAAAHGGLADFIVTGDEDLLSIREHEGIEIVTPRAFLAQL